MIRPLLCATLVAVSCYAADDLVVMRDGTRLVGTVVVDDDRYVVLVIEQGHRVTLDRVQVGAIKRGGAPVAAKPEPVQARAERSWKPRYDDPAFTEQRPWTFGLALAGGWQSGSIDGSGTLTDSGSASTYAIDGDYSLGGGQMTPGLALRLTHDDASGQAGLRLGMQVGQGTASGDSATLGQSNLSALAGWAWGTKTRRHALQGLVGYNFGTLKRDLVLKDGTGAVLAAVSDSSDISGYSIAVESETAWLVGSWALGLLAGVSWTSLSGDSSWTSGTYNGSESLSGNLLAVYAGGTIGLRF